MGPSYVLAHTNAARTNTHQSRATFHVHSEPRDPDLSRKPPFETRSGKRKSGFWQERIRLKRMGPRNQPLRVKSQVSGSNVDPSIHRSIGFFFLLLGFFLCVFFLFFSFFFLLLLFSVCVFSSSSFCVCVCVRVCCVLFVFLFFRRGEVGGRDDRGEHRRAGAQGALQLRGDLELQAPRAPKRSAFRGGEGPGRELAFFFLPPFF